MYMRNIFIRIRYNVKVFIYILHFDLCFPNIHTSFMRTKVS